MLVPVLVPVLVLELDDDDVPPLLLLLLLLLLFVVELVPGVPVVVIDMVPLHPSLDCKRMQETKRRKSKAFISILEPQL